MDANTVASRAIVQAHQMLVEATPGGWPWSQTELVCTAGQIAASMTICQDVLPALEALRQQWLPLDRGRATRLQACAQAVRNAVTALHDLPLSSRPMVEAEALMWHLLTVHRLRFAVRLGLPATADALADAVVALGRAAFVVGADSNAPPALATCLALATSALTCENPEQAAQAVQDSAAALRQACANQRNGTPR